MGAMVGMAVADSVGAFLEFLPVGKKVLVPPCLQSSAKLCWPGLTLQSQDAAGGNAGNWEGSGVSSESE